MDNINIFEIEQQVLDFMRDNNAEPATSISLILDGQIHRYKIQGDKRGEYSGAYCIHTDGLPAGWIEDWHTGSPVKWHFDMSSMHQEQRDYFNSPDYQAKIKKDKIKREKELKAKQAEAAERSRILIQTLPDAPENHPYLQAKQVYPYGVKINNDALAVPLRDIDGNVRSIQWISPDGEKRFQPDTALDGVFWSIALDTVSQNPDSVILLGEGFATMAKVHELTNLPCVAGISCYFMASVAKALKKKFTASRLVIIADNDKATELRRGFNPGLQHARDLVKAGLANGIVYPVFDNPDDGSDWDDFALLFGNEKTSRLLREQIALERLNSKEKTERDTRKSLSGIIKNLDPSVTLPPQEFIGGLFPRNFVSMLIAPPGTGKTIFMQKFSSDLSIGGSIFDGFAEDEPPRNCLILAGEAGYELLTRRATSMKWAINPQRVKVLDQFEAETKDISIMLDEPEGWDNIMRLADMYKPDILFIDTLTSFHEKDENNALEMKPIIKNLALLARSYNMAVVPIHHSRKRLARERNLSLNQDDVVGSSVFNRLVGLIIGIEPMKDDEKVLLVRPLKSWFSTFMPFTFTLKQGFYGGTVVQTDLAPASVNNSKIAVWNYLCSCFSPDEWFSASQIILSKIEGNLSERQVRRILADFVKSGKLNRKGSNKDAEYSITKKE